jgi:hypothetical protein
MEVESGLGNASSGRRLRGDRECTAALTPRNPTFAAEQPSGSWLVHNGYTPEPEATDDGQRRPEHEGQYIRDYRQFPMLIKLLASPSQGGATPLRRMLI